MSISVPVPPNVTAVPALKELPFVGVVMVEVGALLVTVIEIAVLLESVSLSVAVRVIVWVPDWRLLILTD